MVTICRQEDEREEVIRGAELAWRCLAFLPLLERFFCISSGEGNFPESQVKYLFPSVCSMSNQRTSKGISCSSNFLFTL